MLKNPEIIKLLHIGKLISKVKNKCELKEKEYEISPDKLKVMIKKNKVKIIILIPLMFDLLDRSHCITIILNGPPIIKFDVVLTFQI